MKCQDTVDLLLWLNLMDVMEKQQAKIKYCAFHGEEGGNEIAKNVFLYDCDKPQSWSVQMKLWNSVNVMNSTG